MNLRAATELGISYRYMTIFLFFIYIKIFICILGRTYTILNPEFKMNLQKKIFI